MSKIQIVTDQNRETTLSMSMNGHVGVRYIRIDDVEYGHIRVYDDEVDNLIKALQELKQKIDTAQ